MNEYEYTDRIMGSDAAISIVAANKPVADALYLRMRALAEMEEARFSRFRAESELSQLNFRRSMTVSPEFFETYVLSQVLSKRTGGAFNPLLAIANFGYDADIRTVRSTERTSTSEHTVHSMLPRAEGDTRLIELHIGQKLDFGGFLKGYVAEKMARLGTGIAGVIVNLGGDIYTHGYDSDREPFVFSIHNPFMPEEGIEFSVANTAVATSGSYNRHWFVDGKPFFHILNSDGTGNPETDVISATVIAPTGAEADAFATVGIVRGSAEAAKLLEAEGFPYLFICSDGDIQRSASFPILKHQAHSYAQ